MSRYAAAAMCFMSGFVVCANLSRLVGTNPNYDASYGTVAIAVFIAVAATLWEEE